MDGSPHPGYFMGYLCHYLRPPPTRGQFAGPEVAASKAAQPLFYFNTLVRKLVREFFLYHFKVLETEATGGVPHKGSIPGKVPSIYQDPLESCSPGWAWL